MGNLSLRILLVLLFLCVATPLAALDFEREIERQERAVKVKYQRGQRTLASFYRQYPQCQILKGKHRTQCNWMQAAELHTIYQKNHFELQRQRQARWRGGGPMQVSLEPRVR